MNRNLKSSILSILLGASLFTQTVKAKEFSTAEVAAQTMSMECVDYCIVGVCFYLFCTPLGCNIDTTARISHFLPDLFVTVYDEPMENPWEDYRSVMGNAEEAVEKGLISEIAGADLSGGDFTPPQLQANSSIKYKDVSIVGHPLALATQQNISGYICESEVTPFMPYYSSMFDYIGWRWGIPDRFTLASIIPGQREIGSKTMSNLLGNTWGSVYPRQGKLLQKDDAKAAAVFAQRAVDIVTRDNQSHVYNPVNGSSEDSFSLSGSGSDEGTDSSGENKEPLFSDQGSDSSSSSGSGSEGTISGESGSQGGSNEKNDKWQMFSPKNEQKCKPFGNNELNWSKGRIDKKHQYAWNYWRKYECCVPGTGFYIGHTNFEPICVNG